MKEELYIRRTIPECMGSAWTLLSTNVVRVAKALWLPALVMAVVTTATMVADYHLQKEIALSAPTLAGIIVLSVGCVAMIVASIYLDARIIKLLNLQPMRLCVARTAKAFLVGLAVTLLVALVLFALAVACTLVATKGLLPTTVCLAVFALLTLVVVIVVAVLASPLVYTLPKYLFEPATNLRTAMRSYRAGLRSVGYIIGTLLLCTIVAGIAGCVVALPGVIAMLAATFSNQGIAIGDAPGLPSYFTALYGATTFLSVLVGVVIRVWYVFSIYYMYASIETKNGRTE